MNTNVSFNDVLRRLWSYLTPNVLTKTIVSLNTLRGDKVSMLTHLYPHKPLRKTEVTICNHQPDSHFMCGLMSDLVICKFRKSMVIHDTESPY